jgi:hypothetical protein
MFSQIQKYENQTQKRPPKFQKVEPVTIKQFFRAAANKFGPKVPKLQPKAAYNSPLQELEEGAGSDPYLLVLQKNPKVNKNHKKFKTPKKCYALTPQTNILS